MRKFKNIMLAAVAVVSMMMSLVACGGDKAAYEKDVKEILEFQEIGEPESSKELKAAIKKFDVSTKEAKELKKAFDEMLDLFEEMEELVEEYEEEDDADRLLEIVERVEEIMEEAEELAEEGDDLLKEFVEAAEEAGVDEDLLDEIEF